EPLDTLLASLTPSTGPRSSTQARAPSFLARDLSCAERGVARLPWVSSTCLYRALARYALLRRSGADATFVMAIDKKGLAQNGHAWIELEGRPFEEPDDVARYTVTFRYPPLPKDAKTGTP
ncbi:MAG TPA: lasso peptide biosynthesis B2 protein, partial [Polyangiaceae bacterium]|nr:lasso peptide biosynthesis B2 protein [Polyangiaceae bacterium]